MNPERRNLTSPIHVQFLEVLTARHRHSKMRLKHRVTNSGAISS